VSSITILDHYACIEKINGSSIWPRPSYPPYITSQPEMLHVNYSFLLCLPYLNHLVDVRNRNLQAENHHHGHEQTARVTAEKSNFGKVENRCNWVVGEK
jgi:hypothetical protein